ncbi:hypothetical protein B0T25DRAFT_339958 [Lasiosphaeria hispida]|uniref:Uncharacterized protein n=1 Tax=Lasiosphaeria hispida TaxID=260671 RepID=A0AAJ0H6A6_9PEZI|nr:hypothetical protein B0T25DRAFT_339958 [Lasiosphaeria hispida]
MRPLSSIPSMQDVLLTRNPCRSPVGQVKRLELAHRYLWYLAVPPRPGRPKLAGARSEPVKGLFCYAPFAAPPRQTTGTKAVDLAGAPKLQYLCREVPKVVCTHPARSGMDILVQPTPPIPPQPAAVTLGASCVPLASPLDLAFLRAFMPSFPNSKESLLSSSVKSLIIHFPSHAPVTAVLFSRGQQPLFPTTHTPLCSPLSAGLLLARFPGCRDTETLGFQDLERARRDCHVPAVVLSTQNGRASHEQSHSPNWPTERTPQTSPPSLDDVTCFWQTWT